MHKTVKVTAEQRELNMPTNNLNLNQSDVTHLYRNKTFIISELSSTESLSSVEFTANRKIIRKSSGIAKDRHLQANLDLPELKERCAASGNKDLYKLSQQLDPTGDQPSCSNAHRNNANVKRGSVNNLNKPAQKQQVPKSQSSQTVSDNINPNSEASSTESSYETALAGSQSTGDESVEITSTTYVEQAAEPQPQVEGSSTWLQIRCERCAKLHQMMANKIFSFGQSQVSVKQLTFILIFHSIICICAFAFLTYMLCYDLIEYVNEESRYLALMKESSWDRKFFYYIMRLLKVPIF